MIPKPFDAITKVDIDALIANNVIETKTLEYKQNLPGIADSEKNECRADVSSFANASGGDIIYGIEAAVDAKGRTTGGPAKVKPLQNTTPDKAKLHLEQVIRDGIEPRLPVQIKEIDGWEEGGKGSIILVRIPKSFASPHMVKSTGRFYYRHSSGRSPLDVHELRNAFLATDSQAERIRRFIHDRLGQIIADETPVKLSYSHRLVIHVIPIASFLNSERVNLSDKNLWVPTFGPLFGNGSYRYNLDGILFYGNQDEAGYDGYSQFFSNGVVECVDCTFLRQPDGDIAQTGSRTIVGPAYEKHMFTAVQRYLNGFNNIGLMPPVIVSIALLGSKGAVMFPTTHVRRSYPIDRDVVILPDVRIESLSFCPAKALKPAFDALWNACGIFGSPSYDADGEWNPD